MQKAQYCVQKFRIANHDFVLGFTGYFKECFNCLCPNNESQWGPKELLFCMDKKKKSTETSLRSTRKSYRFGTT